MGILYKRETYIKSVTSRHMHRTLAYACAYMEKARHSEVDAKIPWNVGLADGLVASVDQALGP